jgi:hypothetical protein
MQIIKSSNKIDLLRDFAAGDYLSVRPRISYPLPFTYCIIRVYGILSHIGKGGRGKC